VIVLADSSPLITLALAQHFELLREFYGEVIVSGEVHNEIVDAGAGLPGDEELRRSSWIRVASAPSESTPEVMASYVGLGGGEKSIIYLASALNADLVLIDEDRARRAAKRGGFNVAGSIAVLERGAKLGRVDDLQTVFLNLLAQGIRYDRALLNQSLARLGLARLEK
jgi:predicted nucleic acid-binding protein